MLLFAIPIFTTLKFLSKILFWGLTFNSESFRGMKKASPQTDRVEVTSLHGFIYENAARCPVGAALFIVVIMFFLWILYLTHKNLVVKAHKMC